MQDQDDITRLKELLRHTGEFIAYFELAETKMIEWRQEIERQAHYLQTQMQTVQNELHSIHAVLAQIGIADFRITMEKAMGQNETNRHYLEQTCLQFNEHFKYQQEKLQQLTDECISRIEKKSADTAKAIHAQLSQYDGQQFHRIASESCDHVARAANNAVRKSSKLLSLVQFRFGLFAAFTTFVTAFVIVLYLSDELPWEMHHQAKNERQAGRVLLQAWPNLTKEEKSKILHNERQSGS